MQRRARVKPVANLSAARRGVNKASNEDDAKKQQECSTSKDPVDGDRAARGEKSSESAISNEQLVSGDNKDNDSSQNDQITSYRNLSERPQETTASSEPPEEPKPAAASTHKEEGFKAPPTNLSRAENENTSTLSNKFRRPKITPRLNIARATPSATINATTGPIIPEQELDENVLTNEETFEPPPPPSPQSTPATVTSLTPPPPQSHPSPNESRQTGELPMMFSPPSTPFSPPPFTYRSRSDTPRDIPESPGLIINHNLHYPSTPQSPFIPIPHARIRTESICSLKSTTTTVANLQPRKKVRTEDQKILDNKRESRERLSNKKIEKSQLRMFDMIYYNPSTNPMKPRESTQKERSPKKIDLTAELPETPAEPEPPSAVPVPQLRLNANGEMVLDESSLVVENEEQRKNRILLANTNVVMHDELSGSYGYYKRQQRTKDWPQDETIKFFRCLNTVGTDFSLMLNLFPNRSRRDLKLKFKKEEKNNPNLVDKALRNHSVFDIEELQRELEEEDEARRKEAESKSSEVKELVKRKILSKQEAKAKAQQQVKSKIEKILSDGDLILNAVDNRAQDVKENCENSTEAKLKQKRQTRKRKIKDERPDEASTSKTVRVTETLSHSSLFSTSELGNGDLNAENSLDFGVTQNFDAVITKRDEREAEIIHEFMVGVRKIDRGDDGEEELLETANDDFLTNTLSEVSTQNQPRDGAPEMHDEEEEFICDRIFKREIEHSPVTFLMKQEHCKSERPEEEEEEEAEIEPSQSEPLSDELLLQQPPQSVDSQSSLDDEAFLNSLDLERLVIVVKQVDGEDVYDIHETDATTQKLSERPLKLPRHIVDLIVSVMTQED